MAENTLTVVRSGVSGVSEVTPPVGNTDGSKFLNDGKTMLLVANGAEATTVTIVGTPCSHGRTANIVFVCGASKSYLLGPFDKTIFNDANGFTHVTFSQVADMTCAAVRENS